MAARLGPMRVRFTSLENMDRSQISPTQCSQHILLPAQLQVQPAPVTINLQVDMRQGKVC